MILHISDILIFDHFWDLPKMHQFSEMCEKRVKNTVFPKPPVLAGRRVLAPKTGFWGAIPGI